MAIKLRPYSETIKENMSREDLIGWIMQLEGAIEALTKQRDMALGIATINKELAEKEHAEVEKLFGGYRMILNSTDIEMCDGDFARTIAKQMIDEANK